MSPTVNSASVPVDFPRTPTLTAIAGAQPKLPARLVDGHFVVGFTKEELQARFELCQDLVEQLVRYCRRKQDERPDWSEAQLVSKVAKAVRSKGWDLSEPELQWVMARVAAALAA